ncbi:MAG: YdiU family protein [Nitrospinota bacterium]|nr:YdiU family protein [Nitrospinota bacterium]
MRKIEELKFDNSFSRLKADFYQEKDPDPVTGPYLVDFSPGASELIGLQPEESDKPEFLEIFSGNKVLSGSKPLAMVYSGHQFGVYNPRLGDGRGLLLGETLNCDGEKWDIHLKGCGPTHFARGYDGRATLRSSIREYLGGEALHGLGIPTTRSLAVIGIRELIYRETPELAAILVRISDTHIRFGSFEYFHYTNKPDLITELVEYTIARHFPEFENEADKYRLFYKEVIKRTAYLIARWQSFGFVHGVMNTDNMSITGCTFDYGPYGFLDRFNPNFTPNHSDTHGRYSYGSQAEIGYWNLSKLGEALSVVLPLPSLQEELEHYREQFNRFYREEMSQKLGLQIQDSEFSQLVEHLFKLLLKNPVDYTLFFRSLSEFPSGSVDKLKRQFNEGKDLEQFLSLYSKLIDREGLDDEERKIQMDRANPKFILRNYLLQRAIDKALKESDFSEVNRLRIVFQDPFKDRPKIFSTYGIDPEIYASETPESFVEMQLGCSA